MRDLAVGLAGVLGAIFVLVQGVVFAGTSLGVVREHCLDLERSTPVRLEVESGWTYILFPPVFFANIDPPGRCVRNSPLREGLGALGIWELPPPEQQVGEHIAKQGRGPARSGDRDASPSPGRETR